MDGCNSQMGHGWSDFKEVNGQGLTKTFKHVWYLTQITVKIFKLDFFILVLNKLSVVATCSSRIASHLPTAIFD